MTEQADYNFKGPILNTPSVWIGVTLIVIAIIAILLVEEEKDFAEPVPETLQLVE